MRFGVQIQLVRPHQLPQVLGLTPRTKLVDLNEKNI